MTEPQLFCDDLAARVESAAGNGVQWSLSGSGELNVNFVHLEADAAVDEHVADVDIVIVVLSGGGTLRSRGEACDLRAQVLVHVPAGVPRALHASDHGLSYLTVHRRRAGLQIGARRPTP
jgi:quercetin dioxygenase-like cupin family protein